MPIAKFTALRLGCAFASLLTGAHTFATVTEVHWEREGRMKSLYLRERGPGPVAALRHPQG